MTSLVSPGLWPLVSMGQTPTVLSVGSLHPCAQLIEKTLFGFFRCKPQKESTPPSHKGEPPAVLEGIAGIGSLGSNPYFVSFGKVLSISL